MEATERCSKCVAQRKLYNKRYRKTEKGQAARLKAKKKYRKTIKGKIAHKIADKNFKTRYPNHIKAAHAVNNAISAGKLPRPDSLLCHYCSKPAKQYHHWNGYEKEHWLDVVPICIRCHQDEQKTNKILIA